MSNESFNGFIKANIDHIRSVTPRQETISENDEWAKETEWDDAFPELQQNCQL